MLPPRNPAVHRGRICNLNQIHEATSGAGERLVDRAAAIVGSWGFIVAFGIILVGSMLLLGVSWFSAYRYFLPNLLLCIVAGIQVPLVLMNQNRAAARDRMAAELEFEINVKAEYEIMSLHERMDREIAGLNRKLDAILQKSGVDPAPMDRPTHMEVARAGVEALKLVKETKHELRAKEEDLNTRLEAERLKHRGEASMQALLASMTGEQADRLLKLAELEMRKGLSVEQALALVVEKSPGEIAPAIAEALKAKYAAAKPE